MRLFGLPCLEIDKTIIISHVYNKYNKEIPIIAFFRMIRWVFLNKYKYIYNSNNSNLLFFKGYSTERKNDEIAYEKILKCAESYDCVYAEKKITLSNFIVNFFFILIWNYQMKVRGYERIDRYNMCVAGLIARRLIGFLEKKVEYRNYKFGYVYYDLETQDNIFVQFLNSKKINTATFQHGAFTAPGHQSGYAGEGIELSCSISKYYLAWNMMTYEECIRAGRNKDSIIILGIPKCIDEKKREDSNEDKLFGVILNVKELEKQNIELINIANNVSRTLGIKYYIKFHPRLSLEEYDTYIDTDYAIKLPINTTIIEYASKVKFTLMTQSTVYLELLFYKTIVYKLKTGEYDKYNKFSEYDFSSSQELIQLIKKEYSMDLAFNYYCHTDNPALTYKIFFENCRGGKY